MKMRQQAILLLASWVYLISGIEECDFVINEINIDTPAPDIREFYEFMELFAAFCPGGKHPSLQPYFVMIIEEYNNLKEGPTIKFTADLYHATMPEKQRFFTIGSPNTALKPDLAFNNVAVGYYHRQRKQQTSIKQFFPKKDAPASTCGVVPNEALSQFAIVLLKIDRQKLSASDRDLLQSMKLTFYTRTHHYQQRGMVKITPDMEDFIKLNLHDMVIYSKREVFNRCQFFESSWLAEHLQNETDYELRPAPGREFDFTGHPDVSINRCSEYGENRKPFLFTRFKVGKPTPGAENDCSGSHYILEERLPQIVATIPERDVGIEVPPTCSASSSTDISGLDTAVARDRDHQMEISSISPESEVEDDDDSESDSEYDEDKESTPKLDMIIQHLEGLQAQFRRLIPEGFAAPAPTGMEPQGEKRQKTAETQTHRKPWEDTSEFDQYWLTLIKRHHSNFINADIISKEMQTWLQFNYNSQNPAQSTYSCRFCVERAQSHPVTSQVPELAKQEGYFSASGRALYLKLYKHSRSPFHKGAIQTLKDAHRSNLIESISQFQQQERDKLSERQLITSKMLRTVYAETKMNIPFNSHEVLVKLQQINGLDMGVHHYERTIATKMVESISNTMHQYLIQHLKDEDHPISLVLDTSTDNKLINYIITYLQTIENNHPQVYFYRMIRIVGSETAVNMRNLILTAFTEDSLGDTIKKNLVGFGSDGASVMVGRLGGLAKLINDLVDTNMYQVHCMGHRLQLAAGHCFDQISDLKRFEQLVNAIYSFYNNHAVKKKESLRNTAAALGEKFFELTYIFNVRWVASEVSALQALKSNYKSIIVNLESIQVDPDFDAESKATARGYRQRLTDVRFYALLLYLIDLLKVLADKSRQFQKDPSAGGLVIAMENSRKQLLETVELFKTEQGVLINDFLATSKCDKNAPEWRRCRVADIDTANFITDKKDDDDVALEFTQQQHQHFRPLSQLRNDIVDNMVSKLNDYFPEGSFQMFDILDPNNLPTAGRAIAAFVPGIMDVAERFGKDRVETAYEFQDFLSELINNDYNTYSEKKKVKNPAVFWSHYLSSKSIPMGSRLKSLIETVLTLPVGSAEAERGFSIMNHAKYDRRNRLTPRHLEDILRIRINGPPIDEWDAARYTLEWIKEHKHTADPGGVRRQEPQENTFRSNLF